MTVPDHWVQGGSHQHSLARGSLPQKKKILERWWNLFTEMLSKVAFWKFIQIFSAFVLHNGESSCAVKDKTILQQKYIILIVCRVGGIRWKMVWSEHQKYRNMPTWKKFTQKIIAWSGGGRFDSFQVVGQFLSMGNFLVTLELSKSCHGVPSLSRLLSLRTFLDHICPFLRTFYVVWCS